MSGDKQHNNSVQLNSIYLRVELTAQGQLQMQHQLYRVFQEK